MKQILQQIGGAIAFYTCIPLPQAWTLDFERIARWAPVVGLFLAMGIGLVDLGLACLHMPVLTRSVLEVGLWIGLTGGLHLDGVIDTADGLGVMNADQRLTVMSDSRTGAFGVMAGSLLILLKVAALSDLAIPHFLAIVTVMVWGRMAQVMAIASYPNLKPESKGTIHTAFFRGVGDLLPGFISLLVVILGYYIWQPLAWRTIAWGTLGGFGISMGVGYWFNYQFQGMTGDVYGAIVEWTEALVLCCLTLV